MSDLPPVHRPVVQIGDIDPMQFAVGTLEALKEIVFALVPPCGRAALASVLEERATRTCTEHGHDRALAAEMLAGVLANSERTREW